MSRLSNHRCGSARQLPASIPGEPGASPAASRAPLKQPRPLRWAFVACAAILVSACGGGGDDRVAAASDSGQTELRAAGRALPNEATQEVLSPAALAEALALLDTRRQILGETPPASPDPSVQERDLPPGGPSLPPPPGDSHWTPTCAELWGIFISHPTFNMMLRRFRELSNTGAVLPGQQQQLQELMRWLEKNRPRNCLPVDWWRLVFEHQPLPNPKPLADPVDDPFCEYKKVPVPVPVAEPVVKGAAAAVACYVLWKVCKTAAGTVLGGPVGGAVCLATP